VSSLCVESDGLNIYPTNPEQALAYFLATLAANGKSGVTRVGASRVHHCKILWQAGRKRTYVSGQKWDPDGQLPTAVYNHLK
jgi:hypothetical protein